jgi:hypothetical protein
MKKTILFILALMPMIAMADSGKCGNKVYWNYDTNTRSLTFDGEGAMFDYDIRDVAPWHPYIDKIESVVIYDDVATIGDYAFGECKALTSVAIPESVTSIGKDAFFNCSALTTVNPYPAAWHKHHQDERWHCQEGCYEVI